MNEEHGGFEYSCWAKRLPNGAFTPMIAITKYYAIRKQTLKKLFFLDERYKTASEACQVARNVAPKIINGSHPNLTVRDIGPL